MPDRPNQLDSSAQLRAAADRLARLEGQGAELSEPGAVPSTVEMRAVLHELSVHQIELELQNRELLITQEALEVSRARLFELYDLAPVGYLTIGENGVVKEANLTAANLLGFIRSQLVGKYFSQFIVLEDQDTFYRWRKQLLKLRTSEVCELRMLSQGTHTFWARVEANAVLDAEGASIFHTIISDVSERKQAEAEQARLQAQLAQAQKMEAIGALASGIAHDFNNILTGILGGLSLLEEELANSALKQDINEMQELVGRAAHLTQALLGFARRGKVDVRPIDLALEVEEIATMFGRTRKDIIIQREVAPGLLAVLMDRTQLDQVLLNLFINAAQAMPQGGRLLISMANAEPPTEGDRPGGAATDRYVKLVVADTGIGMDEATQLRIFEPFFTTKNAGKGSGLGLASVYGIVESHGGHIQVESRLGQGTTFTLKLPGIDARPRPRTVPPAHVEGGNETILIVDDEEQVRNVCSRMLAKLGYSVVVASSGTQAIEIVQQRQAQISLVILDMTMPEMSGPETYQALQSMVPGIKVLFCSGHSVEFQAQQVHAKGCNGYVQKPFSLTTLAAQVRLAIGPGAQKPFDTSL